MDTAETSERTSRRVITTNHGAAFEADCLAVMSDLNCGSVNTVFADPPFNLGKSYNGKVEPDRTDDEYLAWSRIWIREAVRILSPGGALFIYNLPKWLMPLGSWLMTETDMVFRHWIALTMKNTFSRGKRLYPAHYGILYFTKGEPRVFNKVRTAVPTCRHCGKDIRDYGGYRDRLHPDGLNLSDFWDDTSPLRHPKAKSRPANELKLMIPKRCIQISTHPGDLVLDPFGGGGSTYEAAEREHRLWIGAEIGGVEPIRERLHESGFRPRESTWTTNAGSPSTRLARLLERQQRETLGQSALA